MREIYDNLLTERMLRFGINLVGIAEHMDRDAVHHGRLLGLEHTLQR